MKTTLQLFLLALCLPFLIVSCSSDEGCTSNFANNYDESAIEDCCCTYDVENLVSELIGSYSYDSDRCNSLEKPQNIIIKEDPNVENGVIMTNLYHHEEIEASGTFEDGEVKFESFDEESHCNRRTIITLKSSNLGLELDVKYIGTNPLDNTTTNCYLHGYSCEGILTKV